MKVIIAKNYDEMSKEAFKIVEKQVKNNPETVLGLATGSTPLGLYALMVKDYKENGTDYSKVKTTNLDEYVGITYPHDQSYAFFMRDNLFDKINIKLENTNIENGKAEDLDAECKRYDKVLSGLARDIQVLGIGSNGHIAFNEPNTPFDSTTHVVELTESTIKDNSRLFNDISEVPTKALTMGIKSIMESKNIIIMASGKNKADAVYKLLFGPVTEEVPASILQNHPSVTLIVDEEAGDKIKGKC